MSDIAPVGLFYSYAREDERLRDELAGHLKILERRGLIQVWHDRKISAGQDWAAAIDGQLDRAELVLLLVSKDFLESDYIFGVELKRAMARRDAQACEVVPIIVRAINIEPEDAEDPNFHFMKLQALPTDLKAVESWPNRDEAWTNVAKGLRATVKTIRERRPASAPAAASAQDAPRVSVAPVLMRPSPSPQILMRGSTGTPVTPPGAAVPVPASGSDAVLDRVVAGMMEQVDVAESHRSGHTVIDHARYELQRGAHKLIDMPEQKRVLWVDDQPQNNRHEVAALAKLQIEVIAVQSTGEAMARIAADAQRGEVFDLVISDWSRRGDGSDAVIGLLRALRGAGRQTPVACYHGETDPARRAARAAWAVSEGALGEAVLPSELMVLVERALAAE